MSSLILLKVNMSTKTDTLTFNRIELDIPAHSILRTFATTRKCGLVMRSVASVCLSMCVWVCPARALTFESIDLETLFLVCGNIFKISRSNSYIKVVGWGSKSTEQKDVSVWAVCGWSALDWFSRRQKGNRVYHFLQIHDINHMLRGSDSTVLTATGQVNGKWRTLDPYRIQTPQLIAKKTCHSWLCPRDEPMCQFRCKSFQGGASGQMGEI